jgi:hypothetical protein
MTISGENDRNALPSDLFISHNLLHERWKTSSLKATNSGYYQEGWIAGSSLVKPQNEAYLNGSDESGVFETRDRWLHEGQPGEVDDATSIIAN